MDDHTVIRQGIASLLKSEPDLEVAGEASDGQSAVEVARRLKPDVVLMDVSMPRMDGIEATKLIHSEMPDIRVIGLSMFEEKDRADAMRQAGAVYYLSKNGSPIHVISAIRAYA